MKKMKLAYNGIALLLVLAIFISCDKDFVSIDSDIINENNATNFETDLFRSDVITYNQKLGPVQTNNLPINLLGVYNDGTYGTTTASIVTQLNSSVLDPDFGDNTQLESVVMYIPYFSRIVDVDEDGNAIYDLDSLYGSEPINLTIYENNFFLRDFDPNGEFDDQQTYFSNRSTSNSDFISDTALEGTEIITIENLEFSDEAIEITDDDGEVVQRLAPGLRLELDVDFWKEKIIDMEGQPELSNASNFRDYFRGLYFKAESVNGITGSLVGFNLASQNANIVLNYTRDSDVQDADPIESTYTLTFGPNRINFFDNNFGIALEDGNETEGDDRLYLKGGQGSIATIKLFDGEDENGESVFQNFKDAFTYIQNDEVIQKRLVNEANIVFYVDDNMINGDEPNRIYLYDMDNNTPLIDYALDLQSNTFPSLSIPNHLGILQREGDEPSGKGIKYKMRITEHINNLLLRDSTNVRLGLAVSGNVNLEGAIGQQEVLTPDDTEKVIPISSIISPRGTILHGNTSEDESKRVYLEIFYTCLDTENDCESND